MGDFRTSKRVEANVTEREIKALEAFLSGMTYQQIADRVGFASRANAFRAIHRAVVRRRAERDDLADQAATIVLERLDMLFRAHVTTALDRNNPDQYRATDALLKVMDRQARLQGLSGPVQVEATVRVKDELDDEIATLVRKLKDAGPADALPDTPVLDSIINPEDTSDE